MCLAYADYIMTLQLIGDEFFYGGGGGGDAATPQRKNTGLRKTSYCQLMKVGQNLAVFALFSKFILKQMLAISEA
jgi:hypothetical protein